MIQTDGKGQEDQIAESIVRNHSNIDIDGISYDVELEVHYNDYGNRGVVDVVRVEHDGPADFIHLHELKSKYAIENSTGANEIIRQFKRHINAFFDGSDYIKHTYKGVSYFLDFYACDYNLRHIRENKPLYKTITKQSDKLVGGEKVMVRLIEPDDYTVGFPLQYLGDEFEPDWNGQHRLSDSLSMEGVGE